jgi:hypothetical protein
VQLCISCHIGLHATCINPESVIFWFLLLYKNSPLQYSAVLARATLHNVPEDGIFQHSHRVWSTHEMSAADSNVFK